jgi:uncharacterized FAD-dependent dehydrogenase
MNQKNTPPPKKVVIVGAGPAGLFAAHELSILSPTTQITILEQGQDLDHRLPTDAMKGVGGAGTFSDGKLHFTPVLSHEKLLDLYSVEEYQQYLDYADTLFTQYGCTGPYTPANLETAQELVDDCQQKGVKLYIRRCKHVGSDMLPNFVKNLVSVLTSRQVKIISNCRITDCQSEGGKIVSVTAGEKVYASDCFLLAPGRIGASWLQQQAKKLGLDSATEQIEVGVRIEFPSAVMAHHSAIMHENIYSIETPTFGDIIRTFCPCPNGNVATEHYDDYVCVNGFSNSDLNSPNSNFNFTTPVTLEDPSENTLKYATNIAQLTTLIGGGKPILQSLGDLKGGHRSTWDSLKNNQVSPSLTDVTPGDISLSLPHRIVTNILEGLVILDRVLPGINHSSTLLYAPEIKLRGHRIKVDKNMRSQIPNLFLAGDGAGNSGNIVGAAIAGIIAARGIVNS